MLTPYRHCEGIFAKIVPENGVHAVVIHGKYMPEKWEGGCEKSYHRKSSASPKKLFIFSDL
jgi:hypothetical protein